MFFNMHTLMAKYGVHPKGILHVGAHICEERATYAEAGIGDDRVIWVDAQADLVERARETYGPTLRILHACVDEVTGRRVTFRVTNARAASSILELGDKHKQLHRKVKFSHTTRQITTRLDDLLWAHSVEPGEFDMLNLDIQGVELRALRGLGEEYLSHVTCVYTEINVAEMYVGCTRVEELDAYLGERGFERVATHMFKPGTWGDAIYLRRSAESTKEEEDEGRDDEIAAPAPKRHAPESAVTPATMSQDA